MPILIPIFAIVALAIKLDDGGPVFFVQKRTGYQAKEFSVFKFRTMKVDQGIEDERQRAITQDNDPRVTRIGGFMRKTRIDELPQILNILNGTMSWIGPRPEATSLSDWYSEGLAFYKYRFVVRPGVTGWAQVNQGHVAGLNEVNEKLKYDFYYIKHFSPWLDLLIVLRTIRIVISGFGAK